ncbi:MAG: hypothetical protein OEY49_19260 [Candidatus Heimdallarchaeota archaeon]|nr:hypothetical protein [Candidatus Heimdallarchaeota archaeon]
MLKEVYILREGSSLYHYTTDKSATEEQFILSSGLLTAIQQFVEATRASSIDFFASKNEIFIYEELGDDILMVCIFQNKILQEVARDIIDQIKIHVDYYEINKISSGLRLSKKDSSQLSKKIKAIGESLTSVKYQKLIASEVFHDTPELTSLLLYDSGTNRKVFHESTSPKPKTNTPIYKSLKSINTTVNKIIKGTKLGSNLELMIIDGSKYTIIISKFKTNYNLLYLKNNIISEKILDIPFKIMSLPGFEFFSLQYDNLNSVSEWILNEKQQISTKFGIPPFFQIDSLFVNFFKTIDILLQEYNEEGFDEITIFISGTNKSKIKLSENFVSQEKIIDIFC